MLCSLVTLYVIILLGRVILSWFPITPGTFTAQLFDVLHALTEPLLGPLRRIIPPLGGLDLSPIVAVLIVQLVGGAILC